MYILSRKNSIQFNSCAYYVNFVLMNISREAEMNIDDGEFIGPPPPAVVKEAESANEAERFEEVHNSFFYIYY